MWTGNNSQAILENLVFCATLTLFHTDTLAPHSSLLPPPVPILFFSLPLPFPTAQVVYSFSFAFPHLFCVHFTPWRVSSFTNNLLLRYPPKPNLYPCILIKLSPPQIKISPFCPPSPLFTPIGPKLKLSLSLFLISLPFLFFLLPHSLSLPLPGPSPLELYAPYRQHTYSMSAMSS